MNKQYLMDFGVYMVLGCVFMFCGLVYYVNFVQMLVMRVVKDIKVVRELWKEMFLWVKKYQVGVYVCGGGGGGYKLGKYEYICGLQFIFKFVGILFLLVFFKYFVRDNLYIVLL